MFWQVNGAFTVGAGGQFAGTALTNAAGTIDANAVVNGRVLAEGAVTMDGDEFYSVPPTVTLTGGATADTNNSSPTIGGNDQRWRVGRGHRDRRRSDAHGHPVGLERELVRGPDDLGKRHLHGSGLHDRWGGKRRYCEPAADHRHDPTGHHPQRRADAADQ